MDGNGVVCSQGVFIPDALIDLSGGKNASLVFHEEKENVVFNRCQAYRFAVYQDLFFVVVYL